jgi:hypothetical protein
MVETPVLYITFARPEYARQSFDAIKKVKPKTLYFYSNKGRSDKPEELIRNNEIRSYVNEIDWECNLKLFFRDEYVDIYTSLWGAIDWVFNNEEEAIIIEEDVVGSLAFFDYCEKLLPKYRNNEKVWMLVGSNARPQFSPKGLNYFPSRYVEIMGWAGWADRWKSIDRKLEYWKAFSKSKDFYKFFGKYDMALFFKFRFQKVFNNFQNKDPWDFLFFYSMMYHNKLSIFPSENLIDGIGFMGVHNKGNGVGMFKTSSQLKSVFDVTKEPEILKPTSFDYKYYYDYYLKSFIQRKFKLLARAFVLFDK